MRLGDVIEQIRGVSYKPSDLNDNLSDDSVVLLRANNIQDGKIVLDDVVYVSKSKVSESQFLRQGDILVCTSSGSKELVGKAAFIDEDLPMVFGAFCKVVRPNIECCKYMGYFFQSPYYRKHISEASAGANINNLRNEHIADLHFPLPPLEEQRKIAAVLDKISDLIAKRRTQLDKLDELVKSRFIEMFGDPQSNPHGYQYAKLSDIATYFNGLTYKPENVAEEGTIVLRSSNIQNSQLDFADTVRVNCAIKKRLMVKENDILMCSRNGSAKLVGKVALIKGIQEPTSFGAFMMIIRSQYFGYLMTYFQMDAFRQQIKTGATTTINQITGRMLDDVTIPLPPMALVEQFTAFVAQTDKSKYFGMNGIKLLWKLNDIFLGAICE